MKFRSINDVYELVPPVVFDGVNNRDLPEAEQFVIKVKGISIGELEKMDRETVLDTSRYEPSRRLDEQKKRLYDLVSSKVVTVSGYTLADGRELTTFEELVADGLPEITKWLFPVLSSGELLSAAARKN